MRVIFMCGPAGSGKSTVARALEADGVTRLSFDQEAWARGLREMPLSPTDHREIDRTLRLRLHDLLDEGADVVLDFSFWSRAMRDDWRREIQRHGLDPEIIYLATDRETCLARVGARARSHGDDFALSPRLAAQYFDQFEPPTSDEGNVSILC